MGLAEKSGILRNYYSKLLKEMEEKNMSLTIATQDRRYTVKANDEESNAMFEDIILWMLEGDGMPAAIVERFSNLTQIQVPAAIPEETPVKEETEPAAGQEVHQLYYYRGFLYIECRKCGAIHGFNTKPEIGEYICNKCGGVTPFDEPLKELYVNCECGKRFKYMTNLQSDMFDIRCINCGQPVPVGYNWKKEIYQTIRD